MNFILIAGPVTGLSPPIFSCVGKCKTAADCNNICKPNCVCFKFEGEDYGCCKWLSYTVQVIL